MSLKIVEKHISEETVGVELQGALDSDTAPDLEHWLESAVTPDTRVVAFNMAGVTFISSAGLPGDIQDPEADEGPGRAGQRVPDESGSPESL